LLHTDRTTALISAAKAVDEATFTSRYRTSFLLFPRPGEELMTTEVNLQTLQIEDASLGQLSIPLATLSQLQAQ